MLLPAIRRLTLGELTDEQLRGLIEHGESLLVERKQELPTPPGFGAAIASLANTLGGWLLLGVADDGSVPGWRPKGNADPQSHLAALLHREVEPLPPFVAASRECDGSQLVVVRVFESADSPHIVRPTGAVYVRTSKGKEPADQRTLIELARRGEEAESSARQRLRELPLVQKTLAARDSPAFNEATACDLTAYVRFGLVTTVPHFSDWAISDAGENACFRVAESFTGGPKGFWEAESRPHGRGATALANRTAAVPVKATVVADAGGVVGIGIEHPGTEGQSVTTDTIRHELLLPAITQLAAMLESAEARGRLVADAWVTLPRGGSLHPAPYKGPRHMHVAGEFSLPADEADAQELAQGWIEEIARHWGWSGPEV